MSRIKQRSAKRHPIHNRLPRRTVGFERLEQRQMLAGDLLDSPTGSSGFVEYDDLKISIHGSSNADNVRVDYVPFYGNPAGFTRVVLSNLHGEQIHQYLTMGVWEIEFFGHDGDDTFSNTTNISSTVFGGNGNDTLSGGNAPDVLSGGNGHDNIVGGGGNDQLFGGFGQDNIEGGPGNDTIMGGFHNDVLSGGSGNDQINGQHGSDEINGDWGNDILIGGHNADTINGGFGNDFAHGGSGADTILGSFGDDTLFGSNGNDFINGGAGNDNINGGSGDDQLRGSQGEDGMNGGDGNDSFFGGTGVDSYIGGNGYDRYFLQAEDNVPFVSSADVIVNLHNGGSIPVGLLSNVGTVLTTPGSWSLPEVEVIDEAIGELVQITGNNKLLQNKGELDFIRYGDVYDVYSDGTIGEINTFVGAWNAGGAVALINNSFTGLNWQLKVLKLVQHEIAHNWDQVEENPTFAAFRDIAWIQSDTQPEGYNPALDQSWDDWWYDGSDITFAHKYGKHSPIEDFATAFEAYVGVQMGRGNGYQTAEETAVHMAERFAALDAFFSTL